VPLSGEGGVLGPHLIQCGLSRRLLPYQIASIQPFGQNRKGPKSGGATYAFCQEELDPYLTQCRLGRGLPPYQVAS